MAKVMVVRGLPGSGKSYFTRSLGPEWQRVNRDDLRDMIYGTRLLTQEQEDAITVAETAMVESYLKAGHNVVVDAMHLRNKYVRKWAKLAASYGHEFEIKSFLDVPLEVCIQRDAMREGEARLGEEKIRAIHKRSFPIPKLDLSDIVPLKVEPYVPIPDLDIELAFIVDIDGTCTTGPCDRSPYDWAKVGQDQPRGSVIATVWAHYQAGYTIIFLSGRDAICRPQTREWLTVVFGPIMMSESPLFMRKMGDNRADYVVKLELFNQHVRPYYNVVGVYDDRPQVIRMWRALGLQVFDVAGSEEF